MQKPLSISAGKIARYAINQVAFLKIRRGNSPCVAIGNAVGTHHRGITPDITRNIRGTQRPQRQIKRQVDVGYHRAVQVILIYETGMWKFRYGFQFFVRKFYLGGVGPLVLVHSDKIHNIITHGRYIARNPHVNNVVVRAHYLGINKRRRHGDNRHRQQNLSHGGTARHIIKNSGLSHSCPHPPSGIVLYLCAVPGAANIHTDISNTATVTPDYKHHQDCLLWICSQLLCRRLRRALQ